MSLLVKQCYQQQACALLGGRVRMWFRLHAAVAPCPKNPGMCDHSRLKKDLLNDFLSVNQMQ